MQFKSMVHLADGVYFRDHIYTADAPARVLQEYLPLNDERYLAVVVKNGTVSELLMQAPGSPLTRPRLPERMISSWDEVDNAQIASLEAPKSPPPKMNLDLASIGELRALATAHGISAFGSKAKLVEAIKAAEAK